MFMKPCRMQMKRLFTMALLVFAACVGAIGVYGEAMEVPYLLVTKADQGDKTFLITNDLELRHISANELHVCSSNYDEYLSVAGVESLGIVYAEDLETSLPEVLSKGDIKEWRITSLDGKSVAEGHTGRPDFSKLSLNVMYVITIDGRSYKYLKLQ